MADLKVDENNELVIENGDFAVDYEPTKQDIEDILSASKGEYKHDPLVGVGLHDFINAPIDPFQKTSLRKRIRLQMKYDGLKIVKLDARDISNIKINAERL